MVIDPYVVCSSVKWCCSRSRRVSPDRNGDTQAYGVIHDDRGKIKWPLYVVISPDLRVNHDFSRPKYSHFEISGRAIMIHSDI